jgi:transcriptional regulator with XRE-family HTH domain
VIAEIVNKFQQKQQLTLREMGLALGVSHPTILNWKYGRTEPGTDYLLRCRVDYDDWRREFAEACLQVRLPDIFN